ncbi:hypothetical protein JCM10213v2_008145 [Rhodosporidiobolus nylandii]
MEQHTLTVSGELIVERDAQEQVVAHKESALIASTLRTAHDSHSSPAQASPAYILKPVPRTYQGDSAPAHAHETEDERARRHREVATLRRAQKEGEWEGEGRTSERREREREGLRRLGEDPDSE